MQSLGSDCMKLILDFSGSRFPSALTCKAFLESSPSHTSLEATFNDFYTFAYVAREGLIPPEILKKSCYIAAKRGKEDIYFYAKYILKLPADSCLIYRFAKKNKIIRMDSLRSFETFRLHPSCH